MKRFLFFTLAITLLIKDAHCFPTNTETTPADEDNEIEHGADASTSPAPPADVESESLSGKKRFIISAFKRYSDLLFSQLESTQQIAKDILADPAIAAVDSEEMRGKTEVLRKYVSQSDLSEIEKLPPAEVPNRYYLAIGSMFALGNFDSFARELNATSEQDRTPSEKLLWAALQRHGYQEHLVELEKRGIAVFESYVDDMEKYVKSLSAADREKDKDFVPAYENYTRHPERLSKREFGNQIFEAIFHYAGKIYE